MPYQLDAAVFTASGTGTGSFTVSAAVQGFRTPVAAGAVDGRTYRYRAQNALMTEWEVGTATASSTGTVFSRTVLFSSTGGTVNFTTAPIVAITITEADILQFEEAMSLTAAQKTQGRANIAAVLKGHLHGLTLSTSASSTSFGIAAGEAADSTASDLMVLASAYTKTTGSWAVGSGNGGLDTGTIAGNNFYHVYEIKRPDTGVVDACFSLSASAPTFGSHISSAYTIYRRIGTLYYLTATSVWLHMYQVNDTFMLVTPVLSINGDTTVGTTPALKIVSVPTGIVVEALFSATATNSASNVGLTVSNGQSAITSGVPNPNGAMFVNAAGQFASADLRVFTNTSAQCYFSFSQAANNALYVVTKGWIDRRGRDA